MKISELSPKVTPWKNGAKHRASSWHSEDYIFHGERIRRIFHYGVPMVEFGDMFTEGEDWMIAPLSVGIGSVTDQKYVNILLKDAGSPCKFLRNGGNPRIVNIHNGNEIALPY